MKKILILTALFAASVVAARAEFYVGASLTTTASDIDTAIDNFESEEMGWKAYVGWNFMKVLGAEAGYRDLGTFSEGDENERFSADLAVLDVSARAFLPIGDLFNLYAKVGYANIAWDGKYEDAEGDFSIDEDNWELFYGIGTEFNIGKNFAIRAEWEMYDTDEDLNTLSAGIMFRF
jgi:OOP family OmpA-OmpF porin